MQNIQLVALPSRSASVSSSVLRPGPRGVDPGLELGGDPGLELGGDPRLELEGALGEDSNVVPASRRGSCEYLRDR